MSYENQRPRASKQVAMRTCLVCDKKFRSDGPQYRMCPKCKHGRHIHQGSLPIFDSAPRLAEGLHKIKDVKGTGKKKLVSHALKAHVRKRKTQK